MKDGKIIGIDFGTLSARAVIVSAQDGKVYGREVFEYPHGVISGRMQNGVDLNESEALADAGDYRLALSNCVRGAVRKSGIRKEDIIAIGISATTYTMVPCLNDGTVMSEKQEYAEEPLAYIQLWKDHSALKEAQKIQMRHTEQGAFPALERCGGISNCEWALPKLLRVYEKAPHIFRNVDCFCDLGEWLAMLLTGKRVNSLYTAAYKDLWMPESGWPSKTDLDSLADGFGDAFYQKVTGIISGYDKPCGYLSAEAAEQLGLPVGIPVAAPMGDGSIPGVYFCINHPGCIAITLGTSIGMAFAADKGLMLHGINGVSFGGIVPGRWSYDAGQPCAGDMLDWFCRTAAGEKCIEDAKAAGKDLHSWLSEHASVEPWKNELTVLDWWNGNRSVLNRMDLRGSILGLSLGTTPADLYCAASQAIACSIRKILSYFEENGIIFDKVILCGGIPLKNRFLTGQIASFLKRPIYVSGQTQITAIGAGILGSMATGRSAKDSAASMGSSELVEFMPDQEHASEYDFIYSRWAHYHDLLGNDVF